MEFIEKAVKDFNREELKKRSIYLAFEKFGLNSFSNDLKYFKSHLDSLTEKKIYDALLDQKRLVEL